MTRKFFLSALTAAAALVLTALPVCAAPVDMGDGTLFDAAYYAQRYPDVAAVYGTDANLLYLHYTTFGKNEGRTPYQPTATSTPAATAAASTGSSVYTPDSFEQFDAVWYAQTYPDVAAVYGSDPTLLYQHYTTLGFYEGRPGHKGGTTYVSEKDYGKRMLEIINKHRRENEMYDLVYEFELDNAAMFRCKELKVQFEHTRPDGKGYDTVLPGWAVGKDHAELICRGKETPEDVVEWWYDFRHDGAEMRQLITNYRYGSGGGAFWRDPETGTTYWCFLLARRDHYTDRPGVQSDAYWNK